MRAHALSLSLTLLVAFASIARADVAPMPAPRIGPGIAPVYSATEVAMAGEIVRITIGVDTAEVAAIFTLVNTGTKAETLEVGFPLESHPQRHHLENGRLVVDEWSEHAIELQELSAEVDGASVEALEKDLFVPGRCLLSTRDVYHEGSSRFPGITEAHAPCSWACWPMTFAPGATRSVVVRYTVHTEDVFYEPWSPLLRREVAYILTTGAGWKGPIGSARVEVDFAEASPEGVTLVVPEPTRRDGPTWIWEWKNWKPDTEILLQYRVYRDAQDAVARLVPRVEKKPYDWVLLSDLAQNLEDSGRHAEAAEAFERLHERESGPAVRDHDVFGFQFLVRRGAPYVSAACHVAKNLRAAGRSEEAAAWAKTALARLAILEDCAGRSNFATDGKALMFATRGVDFARWTVCLKAWLDGRDPPPEPERPLKASLAWVLMPTPVGRTGATIAPLGTAATAIALRDEAVTITLHEGSADVRAVFKLENTGQREESLDVGFPCHACPENTRLANGRLTVQSWFAVWREPAPPLRGLSVSVDGAAVTPVVRLGGPVEVLRALENERGESVFGQEEKDAPGVVVASTADPRLGAWESWPVRLGPGETRTVSVGYSLATEDVHQQVSSPVGRRQLTWLRSLARGFRGPIRASKLVLVGADVPLKNVTAAIPAPTRREDGSWTWEGRDLVPEGELLVEYQVHASFEDAARALAARVERNPDDGVALEGLAEALEGLGRMREAAETYEKLDALEARGAWKLDDSIRPRRGHASIGYARHPAYEAARLYQGLGMKEATQRLAKRFLEAAAADTLIDTPRLAECRAWAEGR